MAKKTPDLLSGTLELMVLRLLTKRSEHGFAIARLIQSRSKDVLKVEEGTLYPALHRMEKKGLLESHWEQTPANRRAKFYSLTDRGRKALSEKQKQWKQVSAAVNQVLGVQTS
ncbi:MAG: PadR family transcriptional regulator [Planctomycetota bacterium]